MPRFIGKEIEVKTREGRAEPDAFFFDDRWHEVKEIAAQWFDVGHGATAPKNRNWRTRRHRKLFRVRDAEGVLYEMYYDYKNPDRTAWVLSYRFEDGET